MSVHKARGMTVWLPLLALAFASGVVESGEPPREPPVPRGLPRDMVVSLPTLVENELPMLAIYDIPGPAETRNQIHAMVERIRAGDHDARIDPLDTMSPRIVLARDGALLVDERECAGEYAASFVSTVSPSDASDLLESFVAFSDEYHNSEQLVGTYGGWHRGLTRLCFFDGDRYVELHLPTSDWCAVLSGEDFAAADTPYGDMIIDFVGCYLEIHEAARESRKTVVDESNPAGTSISRYTADRETLRRAREARTALVGSEGENE